MELNITKEIRALMSYIEEVLYAQGFCVDHHGKIHGKGVTYGYITGKKVRFYDHDKASPIYKVRYFTVEKCDAGLEVALYYGNGDIDKFVYRGRDHEAHKATLEAAHNA